jgi:hypothetical protein
MDGGSGYPDLKNKKTKTPVNLPGRFTGVLRLDRYDGIKISREKNEADDSCI